MVTSPSGKGVIIIGGYNGNERKYSNALLELKNKVWVQLKQTLKYAREAHGAIPIPDEWSISNTDEVTTQNQQHDWKQKRNDRKWKRKCRRQQLLREAI